ncbi:hypothetical protein DC487_14045 [Sphingobacterium corticibacter]|uniref:Uncharacterized protein n=1 Tax=Sphingobacterium corticibacter TaxID=2171749 RepID=A0A2T8HGW9_9SPHI|nr:hypothetical protein DC487_14045 [Sphingobacterium corticibacter]
MYRLIYKLYYVIFSNFYNQKIDFPWIIAVFYMALCTASFTLGIAVITNLYHPVRNLFPFDDLPRKSSNMIISICILTSYWLLFHYILFRKMKISKKDGSSPYHEFTPTRKERLLIWIFIFLLIFSAILFKLIEMVFIKY